MCGIAGQFAVDQTARIYKHDIQEMLNIIIHRGPDGEGFYESDSCSLGMRRLSIIDLEGGWQPLFNEDKSLVCVCNGEIYNYIELKQELINHGHIFQTKSDIEVILHLYEEYGTNFVKKLNGMFAIALYDTNKKTLFLFRDRLGKKPLFYLEANGKLYFGSEIKSILACKDIKRRCNYNALDYILTYNYNPTNMTSFDGIFKLMPGEYMCVTSIGITICKYWELKVNFSYDYPPKKEEDIIAELSDLLDDSVKIRLRSDVPVGAFLSGGIDSSFVVASAATEISDISTFSIGFSESKYDERKYSRLVAHYLNTTHYEQIVDDNFFSLLPRTIWLNDNPHGDISFLPSYVLANIAAKHVKAVLTGDGGDELFGGYDKYLNFAKSTNQDVASFFENNSIFSRAQKMLLYSGQLIDVLNNQNCLEYINRILKNAGIRYKNQPLDNINLLLFLETKLLLEGNNLVKPDRMGMGNSLEARMPLMDYRVVEYVSALPSIYKIKDNTTKYLFKIIAAKRLPHDIVYRRKQMFTVPVGEWLKDSLKDMAYKILLSERTMARNLFRMDTVKQMLDKHVSGKENYTRQLRLLIIIELWHRIFIDDMSNEPKELTELVNC